MRRINPNSEFRQFGMPEFASTTGNRNRKIILADNHAIREGTSLTPPRDFGSNGGFGRATLRIPEFDYPFIKAMFPEVNSQDATERTKAWQRFAKSPLSEPYRLDRKKRGPQCRSITVR